MWLGALLQPRPSPRALRLHVIAAAAHHSGSGRRMRRRRWLPLVSFSRQLLFHPLSKVYLGWLGIRRWKPPWVHAACKEQKYMGGLIRGRSQERLKMRHKTTQKSNDKPLFAESIGGNRICSNKLRPQDGRSNGQIFFGRRGTCFSPWKLSANLEEK